VAKHIAAAGASPTLSTVVGNDSLASFVRADLQSAGVAYNALVDETRPTTHKNAFVVDGYRLLKVDTLDNRSISDELVWALHQYINELDSKAVIFSDFRHGIFNSRTIPTLVGAIHPMSYRAADSQVASRWGNITDFKRFNMITPNEREARFCLGDQDSGIRPLASKLHDEAECAMLILKLGERGVFVSFDTRHESSDSYFALDSFADKVVDPVGAGDALLAYAVLGKQISARPVVAAILGVFAASAECELDGNVPIKPEYVLDKIDQAERA
jgi:bifunctional ADP-heptose synthase (sugar kinase/adenylyltransferase)